MIDVLLHICCAPCATVAAEDLEAAGVEWVGLFFNPNIQPFTEYRARRDCASDYARTLGRRIHIVDDYPLESVIDGMRAAPRRCAFCYRLRLERTAAEAAELGARAFSTTLAVSPYQDHELIIEIGRGAAARHGVEFEYRDLRPAYRRSLELARHAGLYRQKYCGCIFSEADRYLKKRGRPGPEARS